MATEHWTEGTWNGIPNYRCNYCAYATPDGLAFIKRHVAGHLLRGEEATAAEVAEATLDFASDTAADLLESLDDDVQSAVVAVLLETEPSGLTGHTAADVRAAVDAVTTTEPEEEE